MEPGDRVMVREAGTVWDGLVGSVIEVDQRGGRVGGIKVELDSPPTGWQPVKPWFSMAEVDRVDG